MRGGTKILVIIMILIILFSTSLIWYFNNKKEDRNIDDEDMEYIDYDLGNITVIGSNKYDINTGDYNNDGLNEIVLVKEIAYKGGRSGPSYFYKIEIYQYLSNDTIDKIWESKEYLSIRKLIVEDFENDGLYEIVYDIERINSKSDTLDHKLMILDFNTKKIVWKFEFSNEMTYYDAFTIEDLNNDGIKDIVLPVESYYSKSYYYDGIYILDYKTKKKLFIWNNINKEIGDLDAIDQLIIKDFNNDNKKEIIIILINYKDRNSHFIIFDNELNMLYKSQYWSGEGIYNIFKINKVYFLSIIINFQDSTSSFKLFNFLNSEILEINDFNFSMDSSIFYKGNIYLIESLYKFDIWGNHNLSVYNLSNNNIEFLIKLEGFYNIYNIIDLNKDEIDEIILGAFVGNVSIISLNNFTIIQIEQI